MVKVYLKGGVWKNSEDEILKAAVQKYGKQQWGRVASLLNKKTAKQAKARWHEWLDPSIRKTEWSRAEEEKLLHLAKLMPAQWKTIAPLVGRTATQCQEHYEYLLDQAAGGDGADDLRKQALKPGQIDAHPETKPARPDPIDMDEDELEMLQEARARLANTQGKKAKRKAREKMLVQAKRLAELQKRRELKQAGLLTQAASKKSRNKKEIDLGVEIPFHKPAPAGFHDTSGEDSRAKTILQNRLKDVDYKKVNESQYRTRDREAAQHKKREENRLKILEQSNHKYKQQKEEVTPARSRGVLTLPQPSVTDSDLQQMTKMHQSQIEHLDIGGSQVTQSLLADYSDKPLPTPMRNNTSVSSKPDLMREASQLRALERGQTPLLLSNEEVVVAQNESENDQLAKPPERPDRMDTGRTPGSIDHRDPKGLNRLPDDSASVGASTFASSKYSIRDLARQERRAAKLARQKLEEALAALPAPQFEYELAAPEQVDDGEDMQVETVEEDQADVEAALQAKKQKEIEKILESRSTVVKRKDLPRPCNLLSFDRNLDACSVEEKLVLEEMKLLLQRDARNHPVITNEKKRKRDESHDNGSSFNALENIPEHAFDTAKTLVENEIQGLVPNYSRPSLVGNVHLHYTDSGWSSNPSTRLASLKMEWEILVDATVSLRKKNLKSETKHNLVTGGYAKRASTLHSGVLDTFAAWRNSGIEEVVYSALQEHERRGALSRTDKLKAEIKALKAVEANLQREYGDLAVRRRRQQVKESK